MRSRVWRTVFRWSTAVGVIFLALLLYNIATQAFGYVAIGNRIDPADWRERVAIEDLDQQTLTKVLKSNISAVCCVSWNRKASEGDYSVTKSMPDRR
jgi:hypothetical protein